MKAIFVAAAAAVVLVQPAAAQSVESPAAAAAEKAERAKMVCKKEEQIGSRLGAKRICMTAEQWAEKAREQREFAEDVQSGAWGQRSDPAVETRMPN